MTIEDKIHRVYAWTGGDANVVEYFDVITFLESANDAILRHMYPFGIPPGITDVPPIYEGDQCELAARYIARRGANGEMVRIENGIHHHWGTVDDRDIMDRIIPYAKVT